MRLQKFLAHAGVASRRAAEDLIVRGKVRVNGKVVRELGTSVNPDDRVDVSGTPVTLHAETTYLVMHKPVNVMTTMRDPEGRRTVADLLPKGVPRVVPVGRLDYDTSGVLLFTNDGELANVLSHPRFGVEKTYRAVVKGRLIPDEIRRLQSGVLLAEFRASGARLKVVATRRETSVLDITVHEGKNRQVRRMFDAVGHPVLALARLRFGPLRLGDLPPGRTRDLTEKELTEACAGTTRALSNMDRLTSLPHAYKLARRDARASRTVVDLPNGASFGGDVVAVCAGPCSVESQEQIGATARAVAARGANVLRGGAFKPRTSPYSFQGLGADALKMLRDAADAHGMAVVTEVLDPRDVALVGEHADMLQIGARNMQNFSLLREAGESSKPVLLKRGLSATIDEWLMAAEYLLVAGNPNVVLCERGIRSFDNATRNLLDLTAVPLLHSLTHLPVIVDPSHGTGVAKLVAPMALAAMAAGADGLLIEVHPQPGSAISDGQQSLTFEQFDALMAQLDIVARAVSRRIPAASLTA